MNNPRIEKIVRPFAALAGAMDLLTGLGLVFLPALTLTLMSVPVPATEALVFVRFVGVFVGGVGASYYVALARENENAVWEVFRFTLVFRAAAGAFVLAAVVSGLWRWPWLAVTATDWGIAAVQGWLLCRREDCA